MTICVTEFVERYVEQHPGLQRRVSRQELRAIWTDLFKEEMDQTGVGYDAFEDVFLRSLSDETGGALQFRMGGWTLNVSEGLVKGGLTSGLLAGMLALGGFPALPALVLPAIVPILFDTKKVRLTVSEQEILASLTLREEVRARVQTPEALYQMLPTNIQRELSRLDFADFLEKCRTAGVADVEQEAGLMLRPMEEARFRVTVS